MKTEDLFIQEIIFKI